MKHALMQQAPVPYKTTSEQEAIQPFAEALITGSLTYSQWDNEQGNYVTRSENKDTIDPSIKNPLDCSCLAP